MRPHYCAILKHVAAFFLWHPVGYTSQTCAKGTYYLCASQFQTVEGKSCTLNDLISGDMTSSYDTLTAPTIKVYTGAGYDDYFYVTMAFSSDYMQTYDNVWADGMTIIASEEIAPGSAIWYRNDNEVSHITFAGQVVEATATPKAFSANVFNLMANPYPIELDLNEDVTWDGLVSDYDTLSAPNIKIYKGDGYDDYFYVTMAFSADYMQTYENVWADGMTIIMDKKVPVGQGFWLKPTTAGTATFNR